MKDLVATKDPEVIHQLQIAAEQWKMLESRYIKE
jgi:hypothetical protein